MVVVGGGGVFALAVSGGVAARDTLPRTSVGCCVPQHVTNVKGTLSRGLMMLAMTMMRRRGRGRRGMGMRMRMTMTLLSQRRYAYFTDSLYPRASAGVLLGPMVHGLRTTKAQAHDNHRFTARRPCNRIAPSQSPGMHTGALNVRCLFSEFTEFQLSAALGEGFGSGFGLRALLQTFKTGVWSGFWCAGCVVRGTCLL